MSDPVLPPTATNRAGVSPVTTGWQLGQELRATVVNGENGSKLLRINGNLYAPLQHLQLDAGRSLTLIVKSLSPYVELGLLNRSLTAERPGNSPAIILSSSIQGWSGQPDAGSGLQHLLSFLNAPSTQPLPSATAALLTALTDRLTVPAQLTSPDTLRTAILDGTLLLAAGQTSTRLSSLDNALTALLLQLVRSLGGAVTGEPRGMLDSHGLALYERVSRAGNEYPLLAARELGEDMLQRSALPRLDREASELFERRWLLELPVNYQDRLRYVTVQFFEERPRRRPQQPVPAWAADFEFDLPGWGTLQVALEVRELLVWLTVTCDNRKVSARLDEKQPLLRERLSRFGLQLAGWQCSTTRSPRGATGNAYPRNRPVPADSVALRNLTISGNSRQVQLANGIPDTLYCAMAAFFGTVFTLAQDLR